MQYETKTHKIHTDTNQWRDLASVVDRTIVTDPTIQQPGFNPIHHTWFLLTVFGLVKARIVQTCTNGFLSNHRHASSRPSTTLLT